MATLISKRRVQLGGAKGVQLLPGRPVQVVDERVEMLLRAGNGLGRRLVAAGVLRVELDQVADDRARRRRITDAVDAVEAGRERMEALAPDELSDAHALLERGAAERAAADREAKADGGKEDGGKSESGKSDDKSDAGGERPLSATSIGDFTVAELEPLIGAIEDGQLLVELAQGEQNGKARKGVVELLEERWQAIGGKED